jgi:hypothetical protein
MVSEAGRSSCGGYHLSESESTLFGADFVLDDSVVIFKGAEVIQDNASEPPEVAEKKNNLVCDNIKNLVYQDYEDSFDHRPLRR